MIRRAARPGGNGENDNTAVGVDHLIDVDPKAHAVEELFRYPDRIAKGDRADYRPRKVVGDAKYEVAATLVG